MQKNNLARLILFLLFAYILAALTWWSVLLFRKNQELFSIRNDLVEMKSAKGSLEADLLSLEKEYARQNKMILGEGVVFAVSILAGLWFIYRSYQKELNLAKKQNEFLVSVTHEINSPLASINLAFDTLKRRKLDEEKKGQLLRSALAETNRLNTLVNNILLAAKVDSQYHYNFEQQDLASLINNQVEKFKTDHPSYKFSYKQEAGDYNLEYDRETMVSLLNNLIENAIKYGGDMVNIDLSRDNERCFIVISDNGPGIDPAYKEMIFNKFYRINSKNDENQKGTGLGLFIVKKIVDAHSGKVELKTPTSGGSQFHINIPIRHT